METKHLFNYKHLGALLCLLFFSSLSVYSKGDTPFKTFSNFWQKYNHENAELTLLTPVSPETLTEMSPLLKKALKVKNDVTYDSPMTVGGVLTALLKEKYGKKSNEKNDFFAIQYSPKSLDFENYLKKYPNSKFADEVKAKLECLKENELLLRALEYNTRKYYEEFANYCNNHPSCDYDGYAALSKNNHQEAEAIIDWYALADRSKGNNPDIYSDYSKYIEKYGNHSLFSDEALDSLNLNKDRYDWNLAKTKDTIIGYKEYMENHDNGMYKWNADLLIKEYELWEEAKTKDKYGYYCSYYAEYPDGKYVEEAIEKMKKEEEEEWNKANSVKGSTEAKLKAYENFVTFYPSGYYASEAQNRITELRLAPYLDNKPSFSSITEICYYSHPGYSYVGLGNLDKSTTITISLTGPTGFSRKLKPGELKWVKVKNGSYKILVQASNTENWWGNAVFKDRVYADGWFTTNTFHGIPMGNNQDETAIKNFMEKVEAVATEESINTLRYIYHGQ